MDVLEGEEFEGRDVVQKVKRLLRLARGKLSLARHSRIFAAIVGIEQAAQGFGHFLRNRWIRRGDTGHQAIDAFSGNERLLHATERFGTSCRAISNPVRSGDG